MRPSAGLLGLPPLSTREVMWCDHHSYYDCV
jgi:hypothetical protein